MPKLRYTIGSNPPVDYDGPVPFSVPSTSADAVTVEAIGAAVTAAAVSAPVSAPAGFALSAPYAPTISRTGSGTSSTFTTDYDFAARKALITPAQTIYVRLTGNNNNDGLTEGNAIRSLDLAVRMANAYGTATKINYGAVASGTRPRYTRSNTQARTGAVLVNGVNVDATYNDSWNTIVPVVDVIFEPSVANGMAENILGAGALTFSATADPNIYSHASGLNRIPVDYNNLDELGCPVRLVPLLTTPANTNAPWPEMNALWALYSNLPNRTGGTYATGVHYWNGSTMFIRSHNNRNLVGTTDIEEAAQTQVNPVLRANTESGANRRYVVEGLGFIGGQDSSMTVRGDNGFRCRADFYNCRFSSSTGGRGGIMIQPTAGTGADVIMVNCASNGHTLDGVNVSADSTLISINCIADWNGWTTSNTNNGYTFHDNSRGIDVGGSYRNNQDRSVHHVHNGGNWHLGTESGTRRGADATDISMAYAVNDTGNSGTRQLWLDNCRIFNGPNGAPQWTSGSGSTSVMNYANMPFTPGPNPAGWTGTFAAYTP